MTLPSLIKGYYYSVLLHLTLFSDFSSVCRTPPRIVSTRKILDQLRKVQTNQDDRIENRNKDLQTQLLELTSLLQK